MSGDAAGEAGRTSSWPPSAVAEGWASAGPLQAGGGSSSFEELTSNPSSATSSSLLSSSWPASAASSSSLDETDSVSPVKEHAEGLVGGVRGLEAVDVRTGAEMTKERLLLLKEEGFKLRRAKDWK